MLMRSLVLVALLLVPAFGEDEIAPLPGNPAIAAHVLNSARKDLRTSRDDFKAMSPDERGVVKGARAAVAATPKGMALAAALGAAADLLEAANDAGEDSAADLCRHMAKSYRAMADELDEDASYLTDEMKEVAPAKRADDTFATAEKLLADAANDDTASPSWDCLKRTDPRMRALALNTKTLARGYATLAEGKHEEKLEAAVAKAAKLQAALEPYFEGVRTSKRDEPEPEPPPKPKGPRIIIPLN